MLRRTARLRREYLYSKSLEDKDRAIYERKRIVKQCIEEGKAIPTELKSEELSLRQSLALDDDRTLAKKPNIDDEYARAGIEDPKVIITTSRDPSSRLAQFAKELRLLIPNAQRINRGGYVMEDVVDACRKNDCTDLIMVHETRGEPDGLVICHLPFGPTAFFGITGTVMRHDIPNVSPMSEAYPHLIFDNFSTPLGQRVKTILQHLFPVCKEDAKRVVTCRNQDDVISLRHHIFTKKGNDVTLSEVGPRFELKLYQVKLGTVDQKDAESEWVLRPYMNTSRKRKALG